MDDLISRQAAIEVAEDAEMLWLKGEIDFIYPKVIKGLRSLPTIEERKKGKWQRRKGSDCWECSQCHAVLENDDLGMHNFYFCYHCGANMMNKSGYMDIEEVHYE